MKDRQIPNTSCHRGIIGDLGTSLVAQILVVLGNLATLKCAALTMSFADVGQFVLLRRVLVFMAPMLLLGLGVGLPRSLGRQLSGSSSGEYGEALLLSGWTLGTLMAILATFTLLLFPASVSNLLLGDPKNANLIKPLAWMIFGHQLFMLVYAISRGRLQIQYANLLQILQIAVLPPVIVYWKGSQGVEAVLYSLGSFSVLISTTASVLLLVRVDVIAAIGHLRRSLKELIHYGFPRVPGDFAAAGLYALPPILVAHRIDLQSAGLLAVGMSLITVLSAAFGPIGLVLLPRLSHSLGQGREVEVRQRLPLLLGATVLIASSVTVIGATFGNTLIGWILSESFVFAKLDLTFLMVAAGANVVFVVLRSVIDASNFRPLNAVHTSISLACLLAVWYVAVRVRPDEALQAISLATCIAFLTLAVLTLWRVCYRFQLDLGDLVRGILQMAQRRTREVDHASGPESEGTTVPVELSWDRLGHERWADSAQEIDSRQGEAGVERSASPSRQIR